MLNRILVLTRLQELTPVWVIIIVYLIIRSIRHKLNYIFDNFNDFDVLYFTETRLDTQIENIFLSNQTRDQRFKSCAYVLKYFCFKPKGSISMYLVSIGILTKVGDIVKV